MSTLIRACRLVLTVLVALLAAAPAAHADLVRPETLLLDSYSPARFGFSGPVGTTEPLTAGVTYAAEVRGTYSRYESALMAGGSKDHLLCGSPEGGPQTPSPGRPPSRVGVDAEFLFARAAQGVCTANLPAPFFQADIGLGYVHPRANGAPFARPARGHAYVYLLQGRGALANFRITDSTTTDNNGVLVITVRPATAADLAGAEPDQDLSADDGTEPGPEDLIAGPVQRRQCVSRRRFTIRLRSTRKDPIRAATVRLNGRIVKVTSQRFKGRLRRVSTIDLRGLPGGRARVDITARLKSGKVRKGVRRYYTCKSKRASGSPRL